VKVDAAYVAVNTPVVDSPPAPNVVDLRRKA